MKTLSRVFSAWIFAALALTASAVVSNPNTLTVTPSTSVYNATASSLTVTVNMGYTQSLSSLDFTVTTPAASGTWKIPTVTGANVPQIIPDPTDAGATGLGFLYSSIPTSPATFSFTLTYPAGMTGNKVVNYTANFTDEATSAVTTINGSFALAPALTAVQSIASRSLTAGTAATSFTPVTATNGAPAYTFAISPALPTGLSLSTTTGAITGTTNVVQAATTYTVAVTDTASGSSSATFSLTVNAALTSTLAVPSKALTINTAAVAFTPVTRTGGTTPFNFAIAPDLPAGLALDTTTGQITGTPTATEAATNHTVTITDSVGATTNKTFSLTVNGPVAAAQNIATRTLTAGTAAVSFTPVAGSGGTGTLSYSISPALPANLSLNTATGAITGTPSAASGPTTFTITVTDTLGANANNTFALTVNGPVTATTTIATKALTAGTAATAFTPVTSAGGTGARTYTISPALPSGLSIAGATGEISGTPAAASGPTTFTVTATDTVGGSAGSTFSLTVNAALNSSVAVASKALTINRAAIAFTPVTRVANTGTAPFSFSIGPVLPAGLAFNTTDGSISGTPTVTATSASYDVMIMDAVGAMITRSFTLLVNPGVTATTQVASSTFNQGTAIASFTPVTATGGTGALSFTVAPALPTGLVMNSAGLISGTPSVSSVSTVYTATATDTNGATGTATFTILVNGPVSATQAIAARSVTANSTIIPFTPVIAGGGTAPYTYTISPALSSGLAINGTTGEITGTPAAAVAPTVYTVTVRDSINAPATATFTLTVNTSVLAVQAIASRAITAGAAATAFRPITAILGTPGYTFTINPALPTGLSMDATGLISGTPAAASGPSTFTVTVQDAAAATSSNTFSLTVNAALAAGATVPSKVLTQNAAATPFTPLALTGGTLPYSWTVTVGTLPAGLSLNGATGVISGTPSVALTATNFTIRGADSGNATVNQTLNLTVNAALTTTVVVPSRTLSAGAAATAFTPVTASAGTPSYTFAISPALPASLAFNTATGEITGTPDAALAATNFTVTATDSVGATSSKSFSLTVNGPLVANQSIATKSLTATAAVAGSGFVPVTGGGGTPPYTYSISPALPASLTLNPATGSITGTAAAALTATPFTITVKDSVNATATNTFTLTVNPALATTLAVPTKMLSAGAAASFTPVTAADGTPNYTFTISPALPSGVTLNGATGAITGTPAASLGATNFTVTATDSVGATSSKSFGLTINSAPTAVTAQVVSNRAVTAGTPVVPFVPLPVQGGTPLFTYSVNPALPTGLVLDPGTGVLSGTAADAAASAVYVVTATDSVGAVVNQNLTLVVNAAPVATVAIPSKIILQNVVATPFTPVTVAGGTPPLTFAVSPALATGLTFSTSTGAVGGTPTVATGVVTHTVTATDSVGAHVSADFTLKVNRAPAITVSPVANASYLVGDTLTLSVTANGSPVPTYQWRKGTTDITGNASATTSTLVVPNLQLADAGAYNVVVTNESGSVTSGSVNVIVYQPPVITTQPVSQTITAGGNASFSVVATGDPTPTYQWRRGGVPFPGATGSTFTLNNVPANGAGNISVVVTNPGGSVTSDTVTLVVNPVAPAFAAGAPTTATAIQGRSFTFGVAINNTPATFSATGLAGPGGLTINADNGLISGVPTTLGTFPITITATNTSGHADLNLSLTVQAPPPVITSAASASGRVGTAFSFTVAATNGPNTYTSSTLPAGLTLNGASGAITGTPTTAGVTTVTITATNASGSVSQPFVISIDPPLNAPVYTGTTTPSGTQGATFTFTPSFGTVTAPYVLTGALPAGLTFNVTTGVISGTPTQTGSFPVTLKATNAGGDTTVALTIIINPAPTAPVITSAGSAAARVGVAFTFTLTSTATPATYSATGLPAGLTLAAATGAITGTPTTFGSFEVEVKATNAVGTGPTSILLINVAPAVNAPVITSAPIAPGTVGQAFNYSLTASNSPTGFAITSGTLPAGLTLDTTGGAITGTPTTAALGETRVWFNATGAAGSGLSLEVLFVIAPAAATPEITSNGTATGQVGQPFQYTITANSATSISAYGASGRPAWLALDTATGIMSGIPTEATTTPITIMLTATNTGGTGNAKTLSLTVQPAPATPIITSPLSASGRVGATFTYQIAASESPTSYVATGLPAGLTLNSTTGAITGTPSVSNTFEVSLRAANTAGLGAASSLVLNIAPAVNAPAITSAAAVSGQVGVTFTYQIVASNAPILSYGIVDASMLPHGLTLNTATGVIGGTPVDDPRLYVVQLTATNAGGTSQPQSLAINLAPALGVPVLTTPLYASGQVGQAFSLTMTATNLTGSAPYAPPIALEAVNLPSGLAVNPATGVIQGTPRVVGTTVASLSATNAAGTGPTRDLTITIQPALTAPVVTGGNEVGQVGVAFSLQITATNTPTSYEVVDAPAWMSVNSTTGVITGTPTKPGSIKVQLIARNAAGASSPADLHLVIHPATGTPVITSSRSVTGTVGTAFSYTVVASPALPAPTFVATGLPAGLTFNPTTGVISGTPTVSSPVGAPFTVTIAPSNSNGLGAPVIIAVTILPNVTFH